MRTRGWRERLGREIKARVEAEASRFELRAKGEVEAELRRAMEAEAERTGIIEAETKTGEEMAEEALERETRRREEVRLRVATETLERAA